MKAPPFTFVVKGKHWYFRRRGEQVPLPGAPGDEAFQLRYDALLRGQAKVVENRAKRAAVARSRRLKVAGSSMPGTIYFIGGNVGPIKIGFTTNIETRLRRLQMNSPRRLRVLAARNGSRRDELELHRRYGEQRLHGEWFKRSPELVAVIESLVDAI